MNEHDILNKAFSDLHASDDTLQKVMNRTHSGKGVRMKPKRIAVLVAAVAVLFSMALAVHGSVLVLMGDHLAVLTPAKDPEKVLDDAFGDTLDTQKPEMYDSQGNLIELPNMERPKLDLEEATKLYGDYISDVDAVFSVGESTFTLKHFMIDETGVGALTWTVENPNGLKYIYGGYGYMCFEDCNPFSEPSIWHFGADGQEKFFASTYPALISRNEDDTKLDLVTYFGTFDNYEVGDHFVWKIESRTSSERKTVQITPVNHIPAKKMAAADGMKLTVGSQGLVIDVNSDEEFNVDKILLHFKDGTQYCVEDWDKMILNSSGSLWRRDAYRFDDLVVLYNRLVDINEVSSVEVTARILHEKLVGEDYEIDWEYKNYVFYP